MLTLTDQQRMLVDGWERIARQEFEAEAFTWRGEVPRENLELLADRGFLGSTSRRSTAAGSRRSNWPCRSTPSDQSVPTPPACSDSSP